VTGKITINGKRTDAVVYVYVDDGPDPDGTRHPATTMAQKNDKFVPALLVIPAGTKVSFPNEDKHDHSVFSPAPSYMDLGRYARKEDKSYTFDDPGEVDIYCDIHYQMKAKIMVMPSSKFAVVTDGKFSLEVPAGRDRHISVWTADTNPYTATVDVVAGKEVQLDPIKITPKLPAKSHMNQAGKPYDSGRY
jgi:plastocyanin